MHTRYFFTSVARISDLEQGNFEVAELPRREWSGGDYVAVAVTGPPSPLYRFELTSGRMVEVMEGARAIGALGKRAATLEATGDWEAIGHDGGLDALTPAGLFGKATSVAPSLPRLMSLRYLGHVLREGRKVAMSDFAAEAPSATYATPTILLIGTSMSAGKTTSGRIIVHELKRAGLNVAGAKFTGAGRYRDVLSFLDAGADAIVDFVDAGLPSTVVPKPEFEVAMQRMLDLLSASQADVVVGEAGASPLEPYNGESAVRMLGRHIACTVLCASDPYAVLGVREAFGIEPDIVTGPTANTRAGIELVRGLTGLTAVNLMEPDSIPVLAEILRRKLPIRLGA